MSTHITCERLPNKHKGRWDRQVCVRITFTSERNNETFPWNVKRDKVKVYVNTFVCDFAAEKHETRRWFDNYLDSLEEVEKGVWEACVLQEWLD